MIITNEEDLRVQCVDVLPEEVAPLREALENELKLSAQRGRQGIGLAAPQIGIAKNMAIVRVESGAAFPLEVDLVNCRIANAYDQAMFTSEGCLSFPGRFEHTMRYQEIHVVNNMVGPNSFIATGLFAVVCQHELDHLRGVLLSDIGMKPKPIVKNVKLKPNDQCFCGSGRKFKRCHQVL